MIIICGWETSVAFWSWVPLSKWVAECYSQAWGWLAGAGLFLPGQLSWVLGLGGILLTDGTDSPPLANCMAYLVSQGDFTPGFISAFIPL